MKTIYANYCVLASFEVDDNATYEEIETMIDDAYAERGFSWSEFDDGEWEAM